VAVVLLTTRAPFDAVVQRAPGSLFTMDADGYVRNTYLLKVTNKLASLDPVAFHVRVDGVPAQDVLVADMALGSTESRTVPMIIRMKASPDLPRTIPLAVHVSTPHQDLKLDATFKTEGRIGAAQ
jgi:IG-like fold at C-terminal of FixG, putative oxidoreductase